MLISSKSPLLVFLSLMLFLNFKTTNDWDQVIYFLAAIFIFSIIQSPDSLLKKALRTKPLAFLGAISYSIYMSHAAVIWIANQFLRLIHKPNEYIRKKNTNNRRDTMGPYNHLLYITNDLTMGLITLIIVILIYKELRDRNK